MDSILPEYEIKELPSRFIPYPEGIKIFAKPYTYGAALNIEMVGRSNVNTMREILSGIKVEGLQKNLLTPQDILFLGIYRNLMSSKHDKIEINSICPKCLKENKTVKTLKAIKFEAIDDFDKSCYPIEVDFDNYTMWFGFLTYKDFDFCLTRYKGVTIYQQALQVLKYKDKTTNEEFEKPAYNAQSGKKEDIARIEAYLEKVRHILYNFVDEDADALVEVIKLLENYGLKPIEIECEDETCKHQYTINVDDNNVLIMPFRSSKVDARDRIKLSRKQDDRLSEFETDEFKGSTSIAGTNTNEGSKKRKQSAKTLENEEQIQYFDKT